jgi:rod shape-determining protein MreC
VDLSPDRLASRRDTLAFAICLVMAIAVRIAPVAVQESIGGAIRSSIIAPFLALEDQILSIKDARVSFARVVAQRDSALVQALAARALIEENEQLRALASLSSRLPMRHVTAQVLHQAGRTEGLTFLLSKGRDDGVVPQAPVVAPEGLLGVVQTVDAATSVAIGWPHPDFRVSARAEDPRIFGIIGPLGTDGPNTMVLELRGVPYEQEVPAGTMIYTSGLGGAAGVYPSGVPIGVVLSVAEEQEGWSATYAVRPIVHPASVSHVIVLTGRDTGAGLGAVFEGRKR